MKKLIKLGTRSGAIVLHNDFILLIYRKKNEKTYYVFPGGSVEENENKQKAAIRELFEETSIVGTAVRLLYHLQIKDIPTEANGVLGYKDEFLFLCTYVSGSPNVSKGSEEYDRTSRENFYEPIWVPIDQIKDILLYPIEVKNLLLKDLKDGFRPNVLEIRLSNSILKHS